MVFPTLPVYLDPPNWSQQQTNQLAGIGTQNPQIPHPPQPPPSTAAAAAVGGGGYQGSIIRPGSMTDRARLAKIPQPDAALECPRCESTNTKFCYYNNYSLSQPRHFCKTCRRYWTRGGALRNVPVGGGCRRNKRTKGSSRTKSPTKANHRHAPGSTSSSANSSSSVCATDVMTGHLTTPAPSQLPFLPPLHRYSDHVNVSGGTGMHFEAIPPTIMTRNGNTSGRDAEFQSGSGSLGDNNGGSMLLNGLAEQWRMPNLQQVHQQFPFLTNLEPPIGLFQFDGENAEPPSSVREGGGRFRSKAMDSSVSGMPQLNTTKMEDDDQGLSLSKNLLGSSGNDLFWAGSSNAWDENPSFASSTSHLL